MMPWGPNCNLHAKTRLHLHTHRWPIKVSVCSNFSVLGLSRIWTTTTNYYGSLDNLLYQYKLLISINYLYLNTQCKNFSCLWQAESSDVISGTWRRLRENLPFKCWSVPPALKDTWGSKIGLNDGVAATADAQACPLWPTKAAHCRASIAFVALSDSDCRRPQPLAPRGWPPGRGARISAGADEMRVTLVDLEVREVGGNRSEGLELFLKLECLCLSHSGKK